MRFGVWAPLAGKSVTLVRGGVRHAMERAEDGWWDTDQEAEPGSSYTFILDDGEPRADPRALSLPEGPEGSSQVTDMYKLVVETARGGECTTEPRVAAAVRRGRRDEFAEHGWDRSDVPDPQSTRTAERSRLDWDELRREPHAQLFWWYRDLIRLRRERGDLRDPRLDRVHVDHDPERQTVLVRRGEHLVAVNLAPYVTIIDLDASPSGDPRSVVLAWDPANTSIDASRLILPAESAAVLGPPASARETPGEYVPPSLPFKDRSSHRACRGRWCRWGRRGSSGGGGFARARCLIWVG